MSGLILGVSTATPRGSVAIVRGDDVLASVSYEDDKRHAERIFGQLDVVLERAGVARSDIDRVACDIGPGSFTGVRVGVASAIGVAFALGVPVVGVCSLQAMALAAHAQSPGHALVVPLLDARRGETFYAAYDAGGVACLEPTHAAVEDTLETLAAQLDESSLMYCGRFAAQLGVIDDKRIVDDDADLPSAAWIARCGARLVDSGEVEPLYVRAPDAIPQKPHKPLF